LKEGGGSVRGRWCVWRDAQWPWCWWQRHKHRVVIWSVQRKLLRNSCHAHTRCKYSAKRWWFMRRNLISWKQKTTRVNKHDHLCVNRLHPYNCCAT
jgi:hypothetical protein